MIRSIRWLAAFALGTALLAVAQGALAQGDSQTGAVAEQPQGSPANAAESGAAGAAHDASSAQAAARAADLDRTPQQCVYVNQISQTVAIDDQTIVFYMKGKKAVYRNYLKHTCPNLAVEGRIGYKTQLNRLCNTDMINVLTSFGSPLDAAGNFTSNFICPLGDFYPITYEEAELLRKQKDHPEESRGSAVKSKSVELPPEKSGATAPPSGQSAPASGDAR